MYLNNISSDDLKKIKSIAFLSYDSYLLYKSLKSKKVKVYLSLNRIDMSLTYSFNLSINYFEFTLYPDKTYKLNTTIKDEYDNLTNAIALFIYEEDSKSTLEELEKRYSYIYPLIKDLASLDKEETKDYYTNKEVFASLLKDIKIKSNAIKHAKFKSLILNKDYDKLVSEKDISIRYIDEFNKEVDTSLYLFFRDFDKDNSSINKYSFDKEDMLFFTQLKECYFLATRDNLGNYHQTFSTKYLDRILYVLEFYPRRHIIINNKIYRIDQTVNEINTYITTSATIATDLKLDEYITSNDLLVLSLNRETNTIYLSKYKNSQEKILTTFLINNKDFPFFLYKGEFISSIVPHLNKSIDISSYILSQSKEFLTEIEYYIELIEDEDNKTSKLTLSTKYILNGIEVDENTYKEETLSDDYNNFISILSKLNLKQNEIIYDNERIYEILSSNISKLNDSVRLFLSDNLKRIKTDSILNFKLITSSGIDWFKTSLSSSTFSSDELKLIIDAYKNKKKFIKFKDSIFNLNSTYNKSELSILDELEIDDSLNGKKLPLYQAIKLSQFTLFNNEVDIEENLLNFFNNLKNYNDTEVKVRKNIPLRAYQITAIKWLETLYKYKLAGILADDMGLGKSLELIEFLDTKKFDKPILIVSPKSIIYNWQNEFKKWKSKKQVVVIDKTKEEREVIYNTINKKGDIVYIISYDSLRIDIDTLKEKKFSYLILDEGQYISNALAKKTLAVKKIIADYKLVLTGTPIQNSLLDLWSIFDFLLPGYFEDYKDFSKTYSSLDSDIELSSKRLKLLISPFILRRKKEDVLKELPEKQTEERYISLDDKSTKIYQAFLSKAREDFTSKKLSKIDILADITRLRQISIDPSSFLDDYKEVSNKLNEAINIILTMTSNGHKVLLFSSFVTILNHLEKLLLEKNINVKKIIGETKAKARIELADKFNYEKEIKVMLVSLKAGGTGLNLIGADTVIILDPWWNVASENQASDRAYRLGQEKKVTIYKLICKNTIEERVLELQKKKEKLSSIIYDDSSFASYSDDDISYLLS